MDILKAYEYGVLHLAEVDQQQGFLISLEIFSPRFQQVKDFWLHGQVPFEQE